METGQVLKERYRLTGRIAVGGMGEVWRAEDEMLHRTVAIKILHPALAADPQFQHRFIQEARTLASLNAPGLIDLYDACEETSPDGSPLSYLVMELVDAKPLSTMLAESGRVEPGKLLPILAQCATALGAAHGAGIVHRDIKPANILVAEDGTVTLIDFGIARRPGDSKLTAAGSVIGTVEYASPEQLRGVKLTGASDIYSLGVVGYECLTGAPPFYGDTAAVIAAHLNREPAPLPDDVPRAVADVITTAMAKDPQQRFGSAAELASACRGAASGTRVMPMGRAQPPVPPTEPIDIEPSSEAPESVDRMLRKRTLTTVLITLGVVLVIVLAVGVAWFAGRNSGGETADDKSSSKSSSSASPSPTGPDAPANSTLANASNDQCVAMDYGLFSDAVVLADCGGDTTKFEFAPDSGNKGVFEIVNTADGDKACVNWRYGDEDVLAGECTPDTAWKFEWIETKAGVDVWRIHSVTNSKFCLAAASGAPQGQDCNDDENQRWETKEAKD
ncbi:serine/threonine protein kinase [Stackebrandtia nassauensis]|uniref:non-specific serine/threonine protein kinase n=1 Tax=Stackebrandtia nassauensis (strain DSM 44728 / CIP 108903 / NRRL B-16338 / NBRC 102104 / LLR-40K-21) TaxID=446470 RepID=D3Q7N3_STANL|nr:serine/threonine-protein kinase [Stackebrandtia nassauensis]ADD44375.1 serine/threonine protein kinase [Stackebrandtia nassauensis DSM 44728]